MKKLAADLSLDKDMLEAVTEKTGVARRAQRGSALAAGRQQLPARRHSQKLRAKVVSSGDLELSYDSVRGVRG